MATTTMKEGKEPYKSGVILYKKWVIRSQTTKSKRRMC